MDTTTIMPAYDIRHTKVGDDIDMLLNIIEQYNDWADGEGVGESSTQIPDPAFHCKHWTEIFASDLVKAMRRKYESAERLTIPAEFLTSF